MTAYAINKKANFDYEILKTFEAGLVLTGPEVKSVRTSTVSLKGGFVHIHDNAAWLTNVHIPKYKFAGNLKEYDPERTRKLLLSKQEISYLMGKSQEKGLTIVPLRVYNKGRHIKLELGVAKGKKKYDKRESIKRRDVKRQTARAIKSNQLD